MGRTICLHLNLVVQLTWSDQNPTPVSLLSCILSTQLKTVKQGHSMYTGHSKPVCCLLQMCLEQSVSRTRLSYRVVDAIQQAFKNVGRLNPSGVHVHSKTSLPYGPLFMWYTAVVPNHRSVGRLVPGCRERMNTLFYFRYIDNHTRKVVLF